jgi:excisionase family DNA binding protein
MSNPFEEINSRLSNIETLLLEIKHGPLETSPLPDQDEFLTVKEAAEFLRLSVPTVYTLISKSQLPVMKRSGRCYFLKAELTKYLKEGRKKTILEIAGEADKYLTSKKGC